MKSVYNFKSAEKDNFFAKMDKTIFSINIKISKRETDRLMKKNQVNGYSSASSLKDNTFSKRFQFKNFNQSAIEEEG